MAEISLFSDEFVDSISELFNSRDRNSATVILAPGHSQPPHTGYRPELCLYAPFNEPVAGLSGRPYASDSIGVRSFPNAIVFKDYGVVKDAKGHFIRETLRSFRYLHPHVSDVSEVELYAVQPEVFVPGNFVYAAHGNYFVFSHFLFETICTVYLLRSLFSIGLVSLIVPSGPQAWPDSLLDAIGISKYSRFPLDKKSVQVGNLILSSTCSVNNTFRPNSIMRDVAKHFVDKWGSRDGERTRLYITREGFSNTSNRVYAEDVALSSMLKELDFITLNPATLSFKEQVRIFSSAEIVVGIHGSAFANLMFAPKGCKVVDILHGSWAQAGGGDWTTNVTNLFEQEYVYLIADSTTTDKQVTLSINPRVVYDQVKEFLKG